MSVGTWILAMQKQARQFEYAVEAEENIHWGEECPEDLDGEFCVKCLPKSVEVGRQWRAFPKYMHTLFFMRHPIEYWRMKSDVKYYFKLAAEHGIS